METLIVNLLQVSIFMSLLAVFLHFIINMLSDNIPAKWRRSAWGVILISLLVPFRPQFSKAFLTVNTPSRLNKNIYLEDIGAIEESTLSLWSQIDISTVILFVWISGIIIFLGFVFFKHLHFMKIAKRWGVRVEDTKTLRILNEMMKSMNIPPGLNIIRSKTVSVPMMAGIFNPILLLPEYDLVEEELEYVLKHELIHYRKFDVLLRLLAILANAVHWFNPLVYLMQRWIHIDCELACDYEVTKAYEHDEKIKYAETIIGVAKYEARYKTAFSTNFYEGKKTMKKRIDYVFADTKTRSALVLIIVAGLIILSIAIGSAIAVVNKDKDSSNYIDENKAKEIALEKTEGGNLLSFDLDNSKAFASYIIKIKDKKFNHLMTIDANSGEITDYDKTEIKQEKKIKEPNSTDNAASVNLISQSQAKNIALNKTGGGKVIGCELENDNGIKKYEVKIIKKNYEHEVEIDAKSGKIIDYDKDLIENDDD